MTILFVYFFINNALANPFDAHEALTIAKASARASERAVEAAGDPAMTHDAIVAARDTITIAATNPTVSGVILDGAREAVAACEADSTKVYEVAYWAVSVASAAAASALVEAAAAEAQVQGTKEARAVVQSAREGALGGMTGVLARISSVSGTSARAVFTAAQDCADAISDTSVEAAGRAEITRERLEECFYLPVDQASRKLGIGSTCLKHNCRKFGIMRWPYRALQSIERLIEKARTSELPASKISIEAIEEQRDAIIRGETIHFSSDIASLRQVFYKIAHTKRKHQGIEEMSDDQ